MEHWKRTIERANRCFMLGELVDAREAYLQALALAQVVDVVPLGHAGSPWIFQDCRAIGTTMAAITAMNIRP